jgi:hypothetical protein
MIFANCRPSGNLTTWLLSVLKSHFNRTRSFVLNSCIVFCERRFVRTFDLQKGFSLSEAVNNGSGKEMVWVPII